MRFFSMIVVFLAVSHGADVADGQDDVVGEGKRSAPSVPAIFIFGDSLIDNGNNNDLPSFAKANYFPYGIDFKGGPTGRFSNGYTIVDTIAELLGLPLIPAYSELSGDNLRYGVNYASAAAGILDITGRNFVSRIPFNQQIRNFESTLDQITNIVGAADLAQPLSKSIFFIGMGSNDYYLNNYLMRNYDTKNQYNAQQFADLLIQQYIQQVNRLYNLGVRKFVVAGLGLMGCIPSILAQSNNGECSEAVNQLILPFNANLKAMANNLLTILPDSRFSFVDISSMFQDLLVNGRSYVWETAAAVALGGTEGRSLVFLSRCQYVFWDAFHPTEAVNVLFGRRSFNGGKEFVYPINVEQLANL